MVSHRAPRQVRAIDIADDLPILSGARHIKAVLLQNLSCALCVSRRVERSQRLGDVLGSDALESELPEVLMRGLELSHGLFSLDRDAVAVGLRDSLIIFHTGVAQRFQIRDNRLLLLRLDLEKGPVEDRIFDSPVALL